LLQISLPDITGPATEIVLSAGIHHQISTQVLLEISLPDITEPMKLFLVHTVRLLDPYGRIKVVMVPVCNVPGAVDGHRNCADSWVLSLNFNPSFAPNLTA
jgi:hypothetical protein